MVNRDGRTLLQSSLTDVVLVGDGLHWGHRSSLAICKISPMQMSLVFLHGSRLPHVSQVRITDEMLHLNITFYTNRTQDNYLQKLHSRLSFDWQERISHYPIFRGGARGEIGGYIPRRSMLAPVRR